MPLKERFLNYNMHGGIRPEDEVFLIFGHGQTPTNPVNLFTIPSNIKIVPYSTCGKLAYFTEEAITKQSRRKYIEQREQISELLYQYNHLFPDMSIAMNTDFTLEGRKYFTYTGIISEDLRPFSFPIAANDAKYKYFAWNDSYDTTSNKSVRVKSLELHRNDIFPVVYNQSYKLSDIIYAISKKSKSTSYVFVLSCRGVLSSSSDARMCGDYKYSFFKDSATRVVDSMANNITKHFQKIIQENIPWITHFAIHMKHQNDDKKILELISNLENKDYIPIMKYIYYHIRSNNFKLFTKLIDSYNTSRLQMGGITMFIINAEALCFIYKIIEHGKDFNKMFELCSENILKKNVSQESKDVCKDIGDTISTVWFPFLAKTDTEIDRICQEIFSFQTKYENG